MFMSPGLVCFMTTFSTPGNEPWLENLMLQASHLEGESGWNDRREKLAKIYGWSGNEFPWLGSVYYFFFLMSSGRCRVSLASYSHISATWWIIPTPSIRRRDLIYHDHLNGTTEYKFIVLIGRLCYVNLDLTCSVSQSRTNLTGSAIVEIQDVGGQVTCNNSACRVLGC